MKIMVSACLTGENCKYNGRNNRNDKVQCTVHQRGSGRLRSSAAEDRTEILKGQRLVDRIPFPVWYPTDNKTGKGISQMNKNLTEIVFILDRSGSMAGLEVDTIGGFNAMVEKQKKDPGEAFLSAVLFNQDSAVIYDRVDIHTVEPMTDRQYSVGGSTALLDAIGGAVHHIANVHKYAREEDRPSKTVFVITTDGMENASRRYSYQQVQRMVKHEQEKYGWEFLFLGANMDAIAAARSFGIREDRAVRYTCDSVGTSLNFTVAAQAISTIRKGKAIEADWSAPIAEDYQKRGR